MKLNEEHISIKTDPDGITVEPEVVGYLRQNGYNIDATNDVRIVPSESRDIGYVVLKVETTELPHGHPELDIVEHQTEAILCSCPDFRYHKLPEIAEGETLESLSPCKHGLKAFRAERAKNDASQEELG